MRALLRLATVSTVFLGVSFVQLPMSQAVEVPETLADRRPVGVGVVVPPFAIDHLGVLWDTEGAAEAHADEEVEEHGAVRFRVDGAWTAWQALTEDGAQADGQWASALVPAGDAEAYQVRGLPAGAVAPRAVALNTTDGPLVEVGRRPAGGANAVDNCLSRAEWGADESLRFDRRDKEIWPPEFYPVQTMTVHHTATANGADPLDTMRAIYRYHAVDRGWGDIGYHYLIDEAGSVYEGRWSGQASDGCSGGAGGADFAHDDGNGLVTAGHTGGYNSGNMGAALLGTFTTASDPAPKAAAVDALENLLAEFASRHKLNPLDDSVSYVNPVNGDSKVVDMISGHRDWAATECPGGNLYAMLPDIRLAVAGRMSNVDAVPSVAITSPGDGEMVTGTPVTVSGTAGDDELLARVEVSVGSTSLGADTDGSPEWSFPWDTGQFDDGTYLVTATATDSAGQKSSSTVTVTVDNVTDPLTVSGVSPNSGKQNTTVTVKVLGTGFADGAVVDLRDGQGTDPVVLTVGFLSSTELTATLKIGKNSGPRKDQPWDVVVTNPTGEPYVLIDGFTVLR